jgi:hypothetical protein
MIIDPQSFMAVEMSRYNAVARAAQEARAVSARRRRTPRRGLVVRFAVWATGRGVHA